MFTPVVVAAVVASAVSAHPPGLSKLRALIEELDRTAEQLKARAAESDKQNARNVQQDAEWAAEDAKSEKVRREVMERLAKQQVRQQAKPTEKTPPPAPKKP